MPTVRGAVRLLLTLALAVGCAGYLGSRAGVSLADRAPTERVSTSTPATSAALATSEGTVGADNRVPTDSPSPEPSPAPSPEPSPAAADLTAASGPGVSYTVHVTHDGHTVTFTSTAPTIAVLIKRMGLTLGKLDTISPPVTAALHEGIGVVVVRVRQTLVHADTPIPFKQVTKPSSKLEMGTQGPGTAGANGISEATTRQTFKDGVLASTVSLGTKVIRAAVDQVTLVGTGQPTFVNHGGSQSGSASWYGTSGLSAASPDLPMGTVVRVTNAVTGQSINVVIRDRGPYAGGDRIIDLSPTAFAQIAPLGAGVVPVKLAW